MAWADAIQPGVRISESVSESGVIADSVFHMWVGRDTQRDAAAVGEALRRTKHASLVVVRFDATLDWIPAALLGEDRVSLPAGNLMYWHDPMPGSSGTGSVDALRSALETRQLVLSDDLECARTVFAHIFGGYRNHYSVNPFLRPVSLGDAYGDWASRLISSPDHLVVLTPRKSNGEAAGAALLGIRPGHVEVLLAGIHADQRARGEYSSMLGAIRDAVRDTGLGSLVISTQSQNVAVQRLWARLGLEPVLAVEIVHSVNSRLARPAG